MEFLHRELISDLNYTDTCTDECFPSDSFCDSNCFNFCLLTCPNRLPPYPPPSHHTLPKRFLVAAVVLGITMVSLICLTVYYKFYSGPCIRRRRSGGGGGGDDRRNQINEEFIDEDHGPVVDHPIWYINTVGLQPSVINSISVCRFKKGEGLVEGTDCSVCLSEFEEDETLRLLPKCSHAFHIPCIDTWLRSHTNCPLCRAPIVVSGSNQGPEGSSSSGEEIGVVGTGNREAISEIRVEIEEQDEDRNRTEAKEGENEGIQPLRRSISLDSLSAFKISQSLANSVANSVADSSVCKENELSGEIGPKRIGSNLGLVRFMSSSSFSRSLQIGPSSLKRSISCGGKLLMQRYSRSINNGSSSSSSSVLPL